MAQERASVRYVIPSTSLPSGELQIAKANSSAGVSVRDVYRAGVVVDAMAVEQVVRGVCSCGVAVFDNKTTGAATRIQRPAQVMVEVWFLEWLPRKRQ